MNILRKILSVIFSRQMLAFIVLVILSIALWFLGPMLSFGGLHPLGSIAMRISLIVLMAALLLFLLLHWPVSILGVAALCILFWHAGPFLAFGDSRPFESVEVRAWIIAIVLICFAAYGLYRLWNRLRKDEELLNRFLLRNQNNEDVGVDGGESQQAKENLRAVTRIVSHALSQLKRMHSRSGLLRYAFESKRYLYELPWYMIIGNPGAGKTTAVINSGLKFPLAEQMGRVFQNINGQGAIAGEGGTKHCDWWFTNNAIFIDTAGRYTSQDSAPQTDSAEWLGFLSLLRKHRTRAPINGAILSVNVTDLIAQDKSQRMAHASYLRERLLQLRQELGIRFPVYVMITKMDVLEGFEPYFGYLTSESRAQVWGFTLPFQQKKSRSWWGGQHSEPEENIVDLSVQVKQNLAELVERLEIGLPLRLQEEFDLGRRRSLYALPQEFESMTRALGPFLEEIFLDSMFDGTQLHNTLRGVYFTSGIQTTQVLAANPRTLLQRLLSVLRGQKHVETVAEDMNSTEGVGHTATVSPRPQTLTGNKGFFLVDLFNRVIIPEADLVKPNLKWETRLFMIRLLGHAIVVLLCIWLSSAFFISHENNRDYLQTVSSHADDLNQKVLTLFSLPVSEQVKVVPDTLDSAQTLPEFPSLDLAEPSHVFRYGLYTPPPIVEKASQTYDGLQDKLLLPLVVQRIETVLREAIRTSNDKLAYDTLRVYLQLYEPKKYDAADLREWLRQDWENLENAQQFTSQEAVAYHINRLFADGRLVQSSGKFNEALVQQARTFLDARPSPLRLYERAKLEMSKENLPEFTLIQAVGPQAGSVFARASGEALDRGIPGLFTYDGYHQVFDKRLNDFVLDARMDDSWVMGREAATDEEIRKKKITELRARVTDDEIMRDIRQQYLAEYAERWQAFLEDIRPVTSSALSVNLIVVRKFAAPDSPLVRLARAAARETTLSRQLVQYDSEKGVLEKAVEQIDKKTMELKRDVGMRAQAKIERDLVDNHFAALREIVTGQPDPVYNQMVVAGTQASGTPMSGSSMVTLVSIMGLINEYHNQLVAADIALTTNNVPQNLSAASLKLKMDAAKLPAPFHGILMALTESNDEKVNETTTVILNAKAQDQMERTLASLAYQVGNPCRQGISGHYPFSDSEYDASIEDFTRIFAGGGAAEDFFQKYLLPYVDTGERPWRYKMGGLGSDSLVSMGSGGLSALAATGSEDANVPTLQGEYVKLLRQYVPNPDVFAQIKDIRRLFFRDGGNKMAWKMDLTIVDIDPSIVELIVNIDGQAQRYVHGPVQTMSITWPGPRGGAVAELTANPRVRPDTSSIITNGPWALFRLLDRGRIINTAHPGRVLVEYDFDGRKATFEISTGSQQNPLTTHMLKNFQCPGGV
jgi:type VI secretion system protein ImpL